MARLPGNQKEDTPTRRWFRAIRGAYGLDQFQMADALGKSRSSIGGYETKIPVPRDTFVEILRLFPDVPPPKDLALPPGLPLGESPIVGDAAYIEPKPYTELRYAGEVPATTWGDPLSADTTEEVDGKYAGKNRFCTRVIGDSCYPALRQGDLAIWESDRNPPHRVIVLAERSEDDGCTVKQLLYDAIEGCDVLKPVNPRYDAPPNGLGWRATARLVGVVRKAEGPEKTWYWPQGLQPKHLLDTHDD